MTVQPLPAEIETTCRHVAAARFRRGGPFAMEDLQQEARLTAWEAVARADHSRNIRAYVGRAISWRISDMYIHERVEPASGTIRYELKVENLPDEASPFDEAIHRLDARGVREWMAGLTRRQRQVLLLHDIAGFTFKETANKLGITEGAAKAIRHRAVEMLRKRAAREEMA